MNLLLIRDIFVHLDSCYFIYFQTFLERPDSNKKIILSLGLRVNFAFKWRPCSRSSWGKLHSFHATILSEKGNLFKKVRVNVFGQFFALKIVVANWRL